MNPLEQLRQRYRQQIADLPTPIRQAYESACRRERLPKGYYLCRQGAICRHVATLESGSARVFH